MKLTWPALATLQLLWLPSWINTCSSGDDDDDTTPPPVTPDPSWGGDTTVTVFDGEHQYYGGGDTRTISVEVTFPDAQWQYDAITLHYTLECPDGGCDPWDRLAYVQVVENAGAADEAAFEVGRFITPYGVGGSWDVDVTDFRPVLEGTRTVTSFIDTWVNPGWLVTVSFEFHGGTPAHQVLEVRKLWAGSYSYGDPANPIEDSLTDQTLAIPGDATGGLIRVLATGHGQGNTENCAEFCEKEHTLVVGSASDTQTVWRADCWTAGAPGQSGTYWYSRAGWCPGDDVTPRIWEIDNYLTPGNNAFFEYQVQPYTNYETSSDAPPYLVISAYLILFE